MTDGGNHESGIQGLGGKIGSVVMGEINGIGGIVVSADEGKYKSNMDENLVVITENKRRRTHEEIIMGQNSSGIWAGHC